ncbi:hypothetical protein O181_013479 [Austropuccinia psidii MF-1]|uniref:Uncharacterized protein n=1 Tax=Austropuccinia psidii MF-1 TaxID=1389203 RepID=A0A9Q3BYB4_9BASI|nr:hypothetical protein [Austropuccinia psidii MF-1]
MPTSYQLHFYYLNFNTSGTPTSNTSQQAPTDILPCLGAQELTIQGGSTVKTIGKKTPMGYLWNSFGLTNLGTIGRNVNFMANKRLLVFISLWATTTFPGQSWPTSHILNLLAFYAIFRMLSSAGHPTGNGPCLFPPQFLRAKITQNRMCPNLVHGLRKSPESPSLQSNGVPLKTKYNLLQFWPRPAQTL